MLFIKSFSIMKRNSTHVKECNLLNIIVPAENEIMHIRIFKQAHIN